MRPEGGQELLADRIATYSGISRGESAPTRPTTMGFHDFGVGAQILRQLGLARIRVMTDKPRIFKGLSGFGLEITEWVSTQGEASSP